MLCPHGQGGSANADIFWTRREGSLFGIVCGNLLWTASNHISKSN